MASISYFSHFRKLLKTLQRTLNKVETESSAYGWTWRSSPSSYREAITASCLSGLYGQSCK